MFNGHHIYTIIEHIDDSATLFAFSQTCTLARSSVIYVLGNIFSIGLMRSTVKSLGTKRATILNKFINIDRLKERAASIDEDGQSSSKGLSIPLIRNDGSYLLNYSLEGLNESLTFLDLVDRMRKTHSVRPMSIKFPEGPAGFPYTDLPHDTTIINASRYGEMKSRLVDALVPFGVDVDDFAKVLEESQAVVSGSIMLHIATTTLTDDDVYWTPGDLDIFCAGDITPILDMFADNAMVFYSLYGTEFLDYGPGCRVTKLQHDSGRTIDVVTIDRVATPQYYVLTYFDINICGWCWDGTRFMGPNSVRYMTGKAHWSTLETRLEKYKERGYELTQCKEHSVICSCTQDVLVIESDSEFIVPLKKISVPYV